jgi:hypothetical protein
MKAAGFCGGAAVRNEIATEVPEENTEGASYDHIRVVFACLAARSQA